MPSILDLKVGGEPPIFGTWNYGIVTLDYWEIQEEYFPIVDYEFNQPGPQVHGLKQSGIFWIHVVSSQILNIYNPLKMSHFTMSYLQLDLCLMQGVNGSPTVVTYSIRWHHCNTIYQTWLFHVLLQLLFRKVVLIHFVKLSDHTIPARL